MRSLNRAETPRAQRREGVVGDLAGPREIPQRRVELLGLEIQLRREVDPEGWPRLEQLADRVVGVPARRLELRVGGRRPRETDVLAEVQRHAPAASAERPGPDPHELATRAQLVEPRGRVRAEASREHVALPHLGRERHALEGDERLSETVRARRLRAGVRRRSATRAGTARARADPRPRPRAEGGRGSRDGCDAAPRDRTTRARCRRAAAPLGPAPRRAPGRGAQERDRRGSGRRAGRSRTARGCGHSGRATTTIASAIGSRKESGSPDGGGTPSASRYRPASSALIQRSSPATLTRATRRSPSSFSSIDPAE